MLMLHIPPASCSVHRWDLILHGCQAPADRLPQAHRHNTGCLTVLTMKAVYPPKTLRRPPALKAAITPRRTPSPPHMPACTTHRQTTVVFELDMRAYPTTN